MRVIRTEVYFEPDDVRTGLFTFSEGQRKRIVPLDNPGISFAFVEGDFSNAEITIDSFFQIEDTSTREADRALRTFIHSALSVSADASVQKDYLTEWMTGFSSAIYSPIVEYVMAQDIVLERSPPFGVPLNNILKGASTLSIGTYVGFEALGGHPLLFLTVPGGIIIVGAAVGIGKALEAGLNKKLKQYLDKKDGR
jgi:hypothetical protein